MDETNEDFDKVLRELAEKGLVEFPLTDDFVKEFVRSMAHEELTQKEETALYLSARAARQDALIKEAKSSVPGSGLTLGQYVRTVRTKANLHTEIADRLGISFNLLMDLEADRRNPLSLPVPTLCNVMEVFRLRFAEFLERVQASISLLAARRQAGQAMARSAETPGSVERGAVTNEALDRLLMRAKVGRSEEPTDKNTIEQIKQELLSRRRGDLLEQ